MKVSEETLIAFVKERGPVTLMDCMDRFHDPNIHRETLRVEISELGRKLIAQNKLCLYKGKMLVLPEQEGQLNVKIDPLT